MRDIPEVWLFRARQAIASGDDPQPAAVAFVRAADRTADLWAASQIRSWTPDPGYIGAILLAGEGDRVATAYERVVMSEGRDDVLMVDVPETERSVFDWTMIGWLRLLRRDWRTLPDLDIEVAEYRRIKNLLAALAADETSVISGVEHVDRGYEAIESKLVALGAQISRIDA